MAVVVTVAKGYDLGYIWKNQGQAGAERTHRRLLHQRCSGRGAAGPVVGPGSTSAGPRVRPGRGAQAVRRGLPAARPADRGQARPAARQLRQVRRSPGPAAGRRAARDRRAGDRAGAGGGPGDPAARRLHRRDGLVLQVDLGAARLDPGKRAPGPAGRRRAGGGLLGRPGGEVPGRSCTGANRAALEYLQGGLG